MLIGSITGKADRTEVYLRLVDSETALILKTAKDELPAGSRMGATPPAQPGQKPAGVKSPPVQQKITQSKIAPGASSGTIEAVEEAQGKLIDVSYRKAGAGGYHQVIGRVENFGKTQLNSPVVSLQLYDASGNLLGGNPCSSPDQPILPGQKLPFSSLFKPPAGFARFEASLDLRSMLFASKSLALSASGLKFRRDADPLPAITSSAG